jgi:V/A-type H+-transporting ATPase subunit G/H
VSWDRKVANGERVAMSSPEIMRRIVQAEKESQQILETAKREISELRKDTPNRIAAMKQQILHEGAEQKEKALADAERAGAQEAERIALEAKRQVQSLSQIPNDRRERAVERAIELLLS